MCDEHVYPVGSSCKEPYDLVLDGLKEEGAGEGYIHSAYPSLANALPWEINASQLLGG